MKQWKNWNSIIKIKGPCGSFLFENIFSKEKHKGNSFSIEKSTFLYFFKYILTKRYYCAIMNT